MGPGAQFVGGQGVGFYTREFIDDTPGVIEVTQRELCPGQAAQRPGVGGIGREGALEVRARAPRVAGVEHRLAHAQGRLDDVATASGSGVAHHRLFSRKRTTSS